MGQSRQGGLSAASSYVRRILFTVGPSVQLTGGIGVHHILDNVGMNEIVRCFNCIAPGGVINCIGFLGGQPEQAIDVCGLALRTGAMLR